MLRKLRLALLHRRERRAHQLRHKSLAHFADWAALNTRLYRARYPDALSPAWGDA